MLDGEHRLLHVLRVAGRDDDGAVDVRGERRALAEEPHRAQLTNPRGATLSGTVTHAATSGVATFSGLSLDKANTGYTLTAQASSLTAATSSSFDITPGAKSKPIGCCRQL